jgi:hypothetical protein
MGKGELEVERDSWDRMTTAIPMVLNQPGAMTLERLIATLGSARV